MKILFYNHTAQVSGAERVLLMILSRLDGSEVQSIVVCPAQGPLPELAADCPAQVETVAGLEARFTWRIDLLLGYLKSSAGVISQLRRKVIEVKPDLIHANSIRSGLVATAATIGLPIAVVWHLHDLLPRHPLSTAIRCFAWLSRRTRMIAVSEAVAKNFRGGTPLLESRISVILNAIELDQFTPDHDAGRKFRTDLGLSESEFVLGIVGQVTARKGHLELLLALAAVLVEQPATILLIVGAPLFNRDKEYLEQLKRTAAELGIESEVRVLGARADVAQIMQALDLLVVNSSTEPFGLVVVEAMACGTTVLATATGGLAEIIEHGRTGWLVPVGDEKALAAAIISLARQPELRAQLASEAKKTVANRFAVERYMTELLDFYRGRQVHSRSAPPTSEQIEAARLVLTPKQH